MRVETCLNYANYGKHCKGRFFFWEARLTNKYQHPNIKNIATALAKNPAWDIKYSSFIIVNFIYRQYNPFLTPRLYLSKPREVGIFELLPLPKLPSLVHEDRAATPSPSQSCSCNNDLREVPLIIDHRLACLSASPEVGSPVGLVRELFAPPG